MGEQEQFRDWLRSRRWFAGKGRTIRDTCVVDQVPLLSGIAIVLLKVWYRDGSEELYQLVRTADSTDALDSPDVQRTLFDLIRQSRQFGKVHFQRLLDIAERGPSRQLRGEQSNTSIAYGQHWILKMYRHLAEGESRDLSLGRFLTRAEFPFSPAVAGCAVYEHMTLGVLQRFVPNQGDAWEYVSGQLRTPNPPEDLAWAAHGLPESDSLLAEMELLGQVTGAMHRALASRPDLPEFAPEAAGEADRAAWIADAHRQLASALAVAPPDIVARRQQFEQAIERMAAGLQPGAVTKIQIHGDYHLGQVLKTADGFAIIDFEGEPARPLAERHAKQPALRDVAGMLRSLHYAAFSAGTEDWADRAGARFYDGWLQGSEGRFVAAGEDRTRRLLDFFQLSKALYELNYELNNRPDWVQVPLRGIERLIVGA